MTLLDININVTLAQVKQHLKIILGIIKSCSTTLNKKNIQNHQKNFGKSKRPMEQQKSHTYEEGGAHLRISFWHLLMTLKNKSFLKKLLKCVNKKQNNFNIYNVAFF